MAASWTFALLAAATLASASPPDHAADRSIERPVDRQEALARYGAPAARTPTSGGGERLRWVRPEESLLAGLYVTTVEVDRDGKVLRVDQGVLRGPGRAAY